ncbi:PH domain-containing protein [Thalassospira lucentensis]|uniref:PH domain-containing protein n=1 Tax=Thalassospira lucentensis TaxID=168935 RepID=UPI003D2EACE5
MSKAQQDDSTGKPFKGIRRHLQDGEVVIMDLPISPVSVLIPGLIKIIWIAALIYASYHWREIYDFLMPEFKSLLTGPEAFAALDQIWEEYEFVFSIALIGVILAALSIIWKVLHRALGVSTRAAKDSILLPLTAIRDLFFFERVITNNRIVTRSGVLRKDQDDRGFESIKSTKISKSVIGNIFDYGNLHITDRLGHSFTLHQVSQPEDVAKKLSDFFGRVHPRQNTGDPVDITHRGHDALLENTQTNSLSGPEG